MDGLPFVPFGSAIFMPGASPPPIPFAPPAPLGFLLAVPSFPTGVFLTGGTGEYSLSCATTA